MTLESRSLLAIIWKTMISNNFCKSKTNLFRMEVKRQFWYKIYSYFYLLHISIFHHLLNFSQHISFYQIFRVLFKALWNFFTFISLGICTLYWNCFWSIIYQTWSLWLNIYTWSLCLSWFGNALSGVLKSLL